MQKKSETLPFFSDTSSKGVAEAISERRTPELVFAFVGPVASGVSTSAKILKNLLENTFGYDVKDIIKISKFIENEANRVGEKPAVNMSRDKRILHLQTVGNKLREKFGPDYLAKKCIEQIAFYRHEDGYDVVELDGGEKRQVPKIKRRAYIIDSLKNGAELNLFKDIYGGIFWFTGVFAPEHIRTDRLVKDGVDKIQIPLIIDRDEEEDVDFGQKVRKIFSKADFFIRNDKSNENYLEKVIRRYLDLVFSTEIHTPNRNESAMYQAASTAAKSGCMSRHVGAAIISPKGELISVGWNDVPKFGGGLYTEDDQNVANEDGDPHDIDHRCYRWGKKICHNDNRKEEIIDNIFKELTEAKSLKKGIKKEDFLKAISGTEVYDLIEFSRAIHAEMEAIIAVSRSHGRSLVGASLYSTTFPCHHCERHIVASGIREVFFIEPYKKSLAEELHPDSISTDEREPNKVIFRQYEGVAPKNIFHLLKHGEKRKVLGKVKVSNPKLAEPLYRPHMDSFTVYEDKIVEELAGVEGREP